MIRRLIKTAVNLVGFWAMTYLVRNFDRNIDGSDAGYFSNTAEWFIILVLAGFGGYFLMKACWLISKKGR